MKKRTLVHNSFIFVLLIMLFVSFWGIGGGYFSSYSQGVYADGPDDLGKFTSDPEYTDRQSKYEELKAQNEDTVGWIYIGGTKVDNVLMQKKDEKDFYIDKGFDKKYLYEGTLYISDISDLTSPSDVVIMYGHNMKDRTMFGSLREFEDPEFLSKNDMIIVDNLEDRKEYEITHVMRIRVNVSGGDDFPYYTYSDFKDEENYNSFIEQCNSHVLYDSGKTTEYGDKFVMLTTCEYTYDDGTGRLVIMGKELEPEVTKAAVTPPAPEEPEPMIGPLEIALIIGGILALVLIIILALVLRGKRK